VPESKVRKSAADKKKQSGKTAAAKQAKAEAPGSRAWVPPTFIVVGLLGVAWLVVYYVTQSVTMTVPFMTGLGSWNVLIGMVLMAGAFAISTLWK